VLWFILHCTGLASCRRRPLTSNVRPHRTSAVFLHTVLADIATLSVDAIVNAANTTLLGGAGVDGAIHAAAGPNLYVACQALGGCPVGEARLTPGFNLRAKFVIHAVGPHWFGGERNEDETLAATYIRSLELAASIGLESIAFPCLSTGLRGFPPERAASVAVQAVRRYFEHPSSVREVWFCCYSHRDHELYRRQLASAA
jgi:O-acetyl-ADP-ribose deacetylase (regulator of RNase III)